MLAVARLGQDFAGADLAAFVFRAQNRFARARFDADGPARVSMKRGLATRNKDLALVGFGRRRARQEEISAREVDADFLGLGFEHYEAFAFDVDLPVFAKADAGRGVFAGADSVLREDFFLFGQIVPQETVLRAALNFLDRLHDLADAFAAFGIGAELLDFAQVEREKDEASRQSQDRIAQARVQKEIAKPRLHPLLYRILKTKY